MVFCHHALNLIPGVDRAENFVFVGNTKDGRCAIWCDDQLQGGY